MPSPTSVPLFQIDAFASKPFTGNPAAVCLLEAARDSEWMLQVAAEMNLSETAFVYPDNGQLRLRWFTPKVEVDLCGHATLATVHILRELSLENSLPFVFQPFRIEVACSSSAAAAFCRQKHPSTAFRSTFR